MHVHDHEMVAQQALERLVQAVALFDVEHVVLATQFDQLLDAVRVHGSFGQHGQHGEGKRGEFRHEAGVEAGKFIVNL